MLAGAGSVADDPAASLLPAGFSLDAPLEAITVNGTMVELDRSMLNDRLQALARGDFGLGEGDFGPNALMQGPAGIAGVGAAVNRRPAAAAEAAAASADEAASAAGAPEAAVGCR